MNFSDMSKEALLDELNRLRNEIQEADMKKAQLGSLVAAQARMQALLHHASDAVIQVSGVDETIQSLNLVALRVFGYEEMELLYRPITELIPIPPQYSGLLPYLEDIVQSNADSDSEKRPIVGLTKKGAIVYLQVAVAKASCDDMTLFEDSVVEYVEEGEAETESYLCIIRDVSEERRILHELKLHRDQLNTMVSARTKDLEAERQKAEKASRAKTEFLANMSHELRTPMHAILSFAEMGQARIDKVSAERLSYYFQRIDDSGRRLLGLINDLLDVSKAEAGKMELIYSETNIVQLVDRVRAEFEGLFLNKALTFTLSVDQACPTCISLDRDKILHVLQNLLSNAVKFSVQEGDIKVIIQPEERYLKTKAKSQEKQRQEGISISVSDMGVGIPDAELSLIFSKFVQSSQTKDGSGGTGLGLAIVKTYVELHGGYVAAANNPQGGAVFTFWLPCRPLSQP